MNIPPNWEVISKAKSPYDPIQVICKGSNNKIQYLYNPLWNILREVLKFKKMKSLTNVLVHYKPDNSDLGQLLWLMFSTCIRTGNNTNNSDHSGLLGLKQKNLIISKNKVFLKFIGKSGVKHCIAITDRKSKKFLKSKKNTGKENKLFQTTGIQLNDYLKKLWGQRFSCKDIRTYQANVKLIEELMKKSNKTPKQHFEYSLQESAELLGHTKNVSKKSYICPSIKEVFLSETEKFKRARKSSSMLLYCLNHYFNN